jgi:hypothetical protein
MALRVDRPAGAAGDDLVVFVAHTIEEARAARDALAAAGIPCGLSDEAIAAAFDGGGPLSIRVAPANLTRALDVIDARFPPPEVELPPLPVAPPAADAPARSDDEEAAALDRAAERSKGPRLEKTAAKTLGIALLSLLLPMAGAIFAVIAVVGAVWCFRRGEGKARTLAAVAAVVGLASAAWNILMLVKFIGERT